MLGAAQRRDLVQRTGRVGNFLLGPVERLPVIARCGLETRAAATAAQSAPTVSVKSSVNSL
jgi:hypothetical protein